MIELATNISLAMLGLGILLTLIRIVRGPTLADRILALEILSVLAIGAVSSYAVFSGLSLYADIAIGLALLSFIPTAALARYLLVRRAE
jgi:multicomponent Na+:H+ antiporter subunit F